MKRFTLILLTVLMAAACRKAQNAAAETEKDGDAK